LGRTSESNIPLLAQALVPSFCTEPCLTFIQIVIKVRSKDNILIVCYLDAQSPLVLR